MYQCQSHFNYTGCYYKLLKWAGLSDCEDRIRDGYHKIRARRCSVSDKAGSYVHRDTRGLPSSEGVTYQQYTSLLGWRGQWGEEESSDPGNGMGQLQRPQESRQEAV